MSRYQGQWQSHVCFALEFLSLLDRVGVPLAKRLIDFHALPLSMPLPLPLFLLDRLDLDNLKVVTTSLPRPEPEWVKEFKGEREKSQSLDKHATVEEECPKCGFNKMSFYTMQMRSVDEGQTVFYTCLRCAHKFSTNT